MSPLTDLFSPTVRRWVYGLASLLTVGIGAWQASGGDWFAAVTLFLGALTAELARQNVSNPETRSIGSLTVDITPTSER